MALLTDKQLQAEINRCEFCVEKPCETACPVNISPRDFLMAAKLGSPSDIERSAAIILSKNPFAAVCGAVCPYTFCKKACVHSQFDSAINITDAQHTIINIAKRKGLLPRFDVSEKKDKKIAVIGAGVAALSASAFLAQKGYSVSVFEKNKKLGGSLRALPEKLLDEKTINSDLSNLLSWGDIKINNNVKVENLTPYFSEYDVVLLGMINESFEELKLKNKTLPKHCFSILNNSDSTENFNSKKKIHTVEKVAAGKNSALIIEAFLSKKEKPEIENYLRNSDSVACEIPVGLETTFFGRKISSPFLLSAAPPTDGYQQMKRAYEAGWAGGVMKTAFDGTPIHIPSQYMFKVTEDTYANCDNVSGHSLDRVVEEVKQLIREFPDRLTLASTGGSVSGNDVFDKNSWQSNTIKLDSSGVFGVEYSLSCPQGGDSAEGAIVSQNPKLAAKIIDWVMEVSNPEIPKLFKLTGAVTSIIPVLREIKKVFNRYPNKKAGVTLANSFPSMIFRAGDKKEWDEGIIAGLSGEGVKNLSNKTLAEAANMGVTISGNGGPMDYKAAADFLALGCETVQFCTVATKYGVEIITELEQGLSYLLKQKGIKSVDELRGIALPNPVTDFMDLTPIKKIPECIDDLCLSCGNCTRCPYMAITLDENKKPVVNSENCIGCSICVKTCFTGALFMRDRIAEEFSIH